jgi:RNA-directed DNA polymerase
MSRPQCSQGAYWYSDDFLVLVSGDRDHTGGMKTQVAAVLAPMGLVLSEHKMSVCEFRHLVSYSSWRRHQKSVSFRPRGARSSHW